MTEEEKWDRQREAMYLAWEREQEEKSIYTLKRKELENGNWKMWAETSDGKIIKEVEKDTLLYCLISLKAELPKAKFINELEITQIKPIRVFMYISKIKEDCYPLFFLKLETAKKYRDYDCNIMDRKVEHDNSFIIEISTFVDSFIHTNIINN